MKQGNYILLAWFDGHAVGGLNDCCGWFDTFNATFDFFKNSSHCKGMTHYQIINTVTWKIVKETDQ